MRTIKTGIVAAGAIVLIILSLIEYAGYKTSQMTHRVDELEQEKVRLVEQVKRLGSSRRVAQITVLGQSFNESGGIVTSLQWQEIGPEGRLGRPLQIDAKGKLIYVEALVVKFEPHFVAEGDADRGESVCMFRRIFGDQQAPESALELGDSVLLSAEPTAENSIARLWDQFWHLIEDSELAQRYGVRTAQCEAPAVPMSIGQVWEVTLDAAGGLNLRRLPALMLRQTSIDG